MNMKSITPVMKHTPGLFPDLVISSREQSDRVIKLLEINQEAEGVPSGFSWLLHQAPTKSSFGAPQFLFRVEVWFVQNDCNEPVTQRKNDEATKSCAL